MDRTTSTVTCSGFYFQGKIRKEERERHKATPVTFPLLNKQPTKVGQTDNRQRNMQSNNNQHWNIVELEKYRI